MCPWGPLRQAMRDAGGRADVHTYTWGIYACSVGRDVTRAVELLDECATQHFQMHRHHERAARAVPPPPPPTRLYNTVLGMCGGAGSMHAAAQAEVRRLSASVV
jgi:hypothetical protein